jgi:hypothetical protein
VEKVYELLKEISLPQIKIVEYFVILPTEKKMLQRKYAM